MCNLKSHKTSTVLIKIICPYCQIVFERLRHRAKNTLNFCSPECHRLYRKIGMNKKTCKFCKKPMANWRKVFCCVECKNKGFNKHAKHTCEYCSNIFKTFPSEIYNGRKFCSRKCCKTFMIGENSPHWRGGKCLQNGRYWQIIRKKVYDRDKVCQCCGTEKSPSGRNLDIHHIKARRYYEDQDEANIINNLIALCAPCHSRLEMAITHNHVESLPIVLKDLALRQ